MCESDSLTLYAEIMGVLICTKEQCDNHAETYVATAGYICEDCKKEFKSYAKTYPVLILSDYDLTQCLIQFFDTPKPVDQGNLETMIDTYFQKHTPNYEKD